MPKNYLLYIKNLSLVLMHQTIISTAFYLYCISILIANYKFFNKIFPIFFNKNIIRYKALVVNEFITKCFLYLLQQKQCNHVTNIQCVGRNTIFFAYSIWLDIKVKSHSSLFVSINKTKKNIL